MTFDNVMAKVTCKSLQLKNKAEFKIVGFRHHFDVCIMKLLKRAGSKQMLTQARGWGGGVVAGCGMET